MRCAVCLVLMSLWGCAGSDAAAAGTSQTDTGGMGDAGVSDSDHDGLCDVTEEQLGTDPHAADTDGDGLPDLIEVGNNFDPTDPQSPQSGRVAYLQAEPSAVVDFQVRFTVNGDGQGVSGGFETITSIYGDGVTAGDFFTGAQAVSADPTDGVRSIDGAAARFASVLGRARLGFSLRFEYPGDGPQRTCARAYPFRYSVKADDGTTLAQQQLLLALTPDAKVGKQVDYCLPSDCQ